MGASPESQSDSPPLAARMDACAAGILIPAFNPGPELGRFLEELDAAVGASRVLIVDDGSETGDFDAAERSGHSVLHVEHGGKGWALREGFAEARRRGWRWAITMDADGQHAPSDLPGFLGLIERGRADIVLGDRMAHTADMPWLRRWTNFTTSRAISHLAHTALPDVQSGYRAVRLAILDAFTLTTKNFDLESEILLRAAWAGLCIEPVPIQTIYRGDEHSHINKWRDTVRFIRLMRQARQWEREPKPGA